MVKKFRKKDKFAQREAQKYENPIVSREFILDFLKDRGRPATLSNVVN
jgi:ribonuclease R